MTRFLIVFTALAGLAGLVACSGDAQTSPPTKAAAAPAAAAPAGDADASPPGALTSVSLSVEGMTCNACSSAIESAVGKLPGVKSCTASHTEKVAKIEFDASKVDKTLLAKTITDLGYTVKLQ
jgi:copper ion binding protein